MSLHIEKRKSITKHENEVFDEIINNKNTELKINTPQKKSILTEKQKNRSRPIVDIVKPLGEIDINLSNGFGEDLGFKIIHENTIYNISDLVYEKLKKVFNEILETPSYRNFCDIEFIKNQYRLWFIKKLKDKNTIDFIDFFEDISKDKIKKFKIGIPISNTEIDYDFNIGEVLFQTIKKSDIDFWFSKYEDKKSGELEKKYKEFQGFTIAIVEIKAVKSKAISLASREINNALSILRIFTGSNFSFKLNNSMDIYLWGASKTKISFLFNQNNELLSNSKGIFNIGNYQQIRQIQIDNLVKSNFYKFYNYKQKSKFQEAIQNSIYIYSKHSVKDDLFSRILYIFSSIESLLLNDEKEPIIANISEKIAFITGKSSQERKETDKLVRNVYNLRSKLVHHGKFMSFESLSIKDRLDLENFLNTVFILFNNTIHLSMKYKTRDEFMNYLKTIKYD